MATIGDVAVRAGVSASTAGRVLSGTGYAGHKTRQKVLAAAEELGYVPNRIARSLRQGSTKLVGLLIADVENSFYSIIAKNVESVLKEDGYHVVLCNDNDDPDEEAEYLTLLQGMGIDGLIVTPTPQSRRPLERLQQKGIVIVQIDRQVPSLHADAVVVDDENISTQAVSHLIDSGHTRIGMLSGPARVTTAKGRLAGYRRALEEHGIPWHPELVRSASFRRHHAIADATELIKSRPRPTALFAANNILAEACILALREQQMSVPADMSLLAFDDLPWMSLMSPALTTVRQPVADMASTAAELLLRRLRDRQSRPTTVQIQAELVMRDSIAPRGRGAAVRK